MHVSGSFGAAGGVESVTMRRIVPRMTSGIRHERDGVAGRLAHLAAVQPGQRRDALGDERPRLPQRGSRVRAGELLRQVDGDLQVLRLVGPDGHLVGVEAEDVGGHQERVAVQAHVDAVVGIPARRGVRGDGRLVGVRAVQQALRGHGGEQRRQPRDRGHAALAVQVHVGPLEPAGEQRGGEPLRAVGQHGGIGTAVERVQVGDEHVDVAALVRGEPGQGPDRTGEVAEVQLAGRLDAGERRDAVVGGGGGHRGSPARPGRGTGASEVTVGARWPAPSGGGRAGRSGNGLPASGRPTTKPRAAPGWRR